MNDEIIACVSCSRNCYPLIGLVIKVKQKIFFYRFYDDLRFKILISRLKHERVRKVIVPERDIMNKILNDFECIPINRSYFHTKVEINNQNHQDRHKTKHRDKDTEKHKEEYKYENNVKHKEEDKYENTERHKEKDKYENTGKHKEEDKYENTGKHKEEDKYENTERHKEKYRYGDKDTEKHEGEDKNIEVNNYNDCDYKDFLFKQPVEYYFTIAAYNAMDSYLAGRYSININTCELECRTYTIGRMVMAHRTILDLNILDTKNSVYRKIRNTKSRIGDRFLRHSLLQPLADPAEIATRHDILRFIGEHDDFRKSLSAYLGGVVDCGSVVEALALVRGNGLGEWRNSILNCLRIKRFMKNVGELVGIFHFYFEIDGELRAEFRENLQENLESSEALSSATISGSDSDHLKIDLYVKGDTFNRNSNSEKSNMEFIDKEKRVFNKEIDIKKNNMKTSRCPKENKISETGYKIPINGNGNGKHKKTSIPPCLRTIISTVVKHDFSNANLNINAENVGINEIIYGVDSNDEFLALTRKIYEENLQDMEMIKETFMNDRGIEIGLVYNSSKGYLFKCSYEEMFKNSSNSKGLTEKIRQKKNKPSVSYFNEPANGFINKSMNVSSAEIILNENKKQNYPFSALTELTNSKEEGNRLLRNKNDGYFSIQEECGSSEENSRDNYFYHGNRGLNKKYNDAYDLNMSNVDCNELNCVDYSSISGDLDDQKCRNGNFLGESLQDNFHVNSPIKNTSTSVFDDLDPIILFKRKEQIFFTTIEAQKINSRITACIDEIIKICGMICIETEKRFAKHRSDFLEISETIAELDMINSFFLFATKNKCRIPSFGDTIAISNTSHLFLQKNAVRNSVYADEQLNIQFVTGGNMCGKTTYVKQIGLLTVLGQIGSPINGNGSLRIFKKMVTRLVRSSNENEFEETGYFWKLIDSNGAKAKNYSKNGNDDPGKDFKDNEFNYKADENSNNECNEYLKDDSKNKPSDTLIIVDEIGRSLFYKEGLCFLLAFTKMLIKRNIFAYIVTHYTEVLNYLEDDEVNVIKAENYCISGGLGVSDCAIELCREYFPPRIIEGSVYLKRKYLDLENIRGLKFDNSYVRVAKRLKKDENIDIKKYLKKDLQ